MAKHTKSIHHQMLRAAWVEEKALQGAGLREVDVNRAREETSWQDDEYPIGPCAANMDTLRKLYGEE